jgi:hypothetical protein
MRSINLNETVKIDQIIGEIALLDYSAKKELIERILDLFVKIENDNSPKLTDLKGSGKLQWKDTNIEDYIQKERQWD